MKFTASDRKILESYKSVLEGLADYLGPGYEIVLHSLENLSCSAVKVFNGHYSGREEGAPITDLALHMLEEIKKTGSPCMNKIYMNQSSSGTPIRSATFPITGSHDNIIGLICINFYTNVPLNELFEHLSGGRTGNEQRETYASDSAELIHTVITTARSHIYNNPSISSTDKNKEIIHYLYDKNIFDIKNSVQIVSEYLGISKNTVYLHLRNIRNGGRATQNKECIAV